MLTIISCKNSDSNESKNEKIKATSWLLGNWENKAADGNLKENWQKVNDSTFQAQSYYIKKKIRYILKLLLCNKKESY